MLNGKMADVAVMVNTVFEPAAKTAGMHISHSSFAITRLNEVTFLLVADSTERLISFGKLIQLLSGDFMAGHLFLVSPD